MAKKKDSKHRGTSSQSSTPSYETEMIIVIILLLLAYPLGLIFMWAWMGIWPRWLKIVLSLPLIIAFILLAFILYFIAAIIHNSRIYTYPPHRVERMQSQEYWNSNTITPQ